MSVNNLEIISIKESENLLGKGVWVICGRNETDDLNYMFKHTKLKSIKVVPKNKDDYKADFNVYLGRWDEICPIFCLNGKLKQTYTINNSYLHICTDKGESISTLRGLYLHPNWYIVGIKEKQKSIKTLLSLLGE